jgi:hypothetical protein
VPATGGRSNALCVLLRERLGGVGYCSEQLRRAWGSSLERPRDFDVALVGIRADRSPVSVSEVSGRPRRVLEVGNGEQQAFEL